MFDLKSNADNKTFVHYKTFKVADESDSYRLTIGDYQTSPAGDAMADHNNMLFSTKDRDNDDKVDVDCAAEDKGGWWYGSCGPANLNGLYGQTSAQRKLKWRTWTNNEIINEAEIKIRSKSGRFRDVLLFHDYISRDTLMGSRFVSVEKMSLTTQH